MIRPARLQARVLLLAAAAAGSGLGISSPALAFIRATLSATDATPLRWDLDETQLSLPGVVGGEIVFVVDTAGSSNIPTTEDTDAVVRAFQHWEGIGTSRVAFVHGTDQAIQAANDDGINAVYWAEGSRTQIGGSNVNVTGWVTMTPVFTVTSGAGKGLIRDANIILNGRQFTWTVHPETDPASWDVEAIVTHEIGHLLGLDHSGVLGSAMSPRFTSGEARSRVPEDDDMIGASEIYPDGKYGIATGAISGSIGRPAAVFGGLATVLDAGGRVISESITGSNGGYVAPGLDSGPHEVYVEPLDKTPPTSTNLFDETDLGGIYGTTVDPNFNATLSLPATVTAPSTTGGISFLVGSTAPLINISKIGGRATTIASLIWSTAPTFAIQGESTIYLGVAGPNIDSSAQFEFTGPGITDNGEVDSGSVDGEPYTIHSFSIAGNAPLGLRSIRVTNQTFGRTYATGALEIYPVLSMSTVSPGVFNLPPGEVNSGRLPAQNPLELTLRGADLDLEWDDEPGAYGYHVYRGTLASVAAGIYDHQMIPGTKNGACQVTGSYLSLKGEALDMVDRYYLVTAYNNAGEGITGRSSTNATLPPASPACPVP